MLFNGITKINIYLHNPPVRENNCFQSKLNCTALVFTRLGHAHFCYSRKHHRVLTHHKSLLQRVLPNTVTIEQKLPKISLNVGFEISLCFSSRALSTLIQTYIAIESFWISLLLIDAMSPYAHMK